MTLMINDLFCFFTLQIVPVINASFISFFFKENLDAELTSNFINTWLYFFLHTIKIRLNCFTFRREYFALNTCIFNMFLQNCDKNVTLFCQISKDRFHLIILVGTFYYSIVLILHTHHFNKGKSAPLLLHMYATCVYISHILKELQINNQNICH